MARALPKRAPPARSRAVGHLVEETGLENEISIPAEIDKIAFSLLTKKDLIDAGSPIINNKEDPTPNKPETLSGSLYDPRMGYSSFYSACATCGLSEVECPGHLGYIDFEGQAYVVYPFAGTIVASLLNIMCQHCGVPLFTTADLALYNLERLPLVTKIHRIEEILPINGREAIRCPTIRTDTTATRACRDKGNMIAKYSDADLVIYLNDPKKSRGKDSDKAKAVLDATDIYRIFKQFETHTELVEALGFKTFLPSDLIMTFLPVIPPCMRETTTKGLAVKNRDYIAKEYKAVMSNLAVLKKGAITKKDPRQSILLKIGTIFGIKTLKGRGGTDEFKGYKQILGAKKGIIRGKMQGKRCDLTARSVVIPDPDILPDEIGIPEIMCLPVTSNTLYSRLPITDINRDYIIQLYKNGKITRYYPPESVQLGEGVMLDPTGKRDYPFTVGGEVGAPVTDGDEAMFNRNPSIHRISLLGFKVKIVDGLCFRVNPAIVTKFNMDFDGDESNLKILIRWTSKAESVYIASNSANAVNSENSTGSNGVIQDNITGAYMMSNATDIPYRALPDSAITNILAALRHQEDVRTLDKRLAAAGMTTRNPRGLLSSIFPASFSYRSGEVLIHRGVLVKGTITKSHIGPGGRGTIQQYLAYYGFLYGRNRERDFLMDASKVTGDWLSGQHGFTVGYTDMLVNDPRINEQRKIVNSRVQTVVKELERETTPQDEREEARIEQQIAAVLNQAEGVGIMVTNQVMEGNNQIRTMVKSGAKGNSVHLANITALLGQQFVSNARPPLDMTNGTRSMAYALPNSTDPEDRGWSINNYNIGLNPKETYTQQVATRPLLADTSLKTGDVGDLAHRVGLALENFVVQYDGTVRDANKVIMSYITGIDGTDPMRILPQKDKTGFFADIESLFMIVNAEYLNAKL